MKDNNIWTTVIVAIIVAIVVSIVTGMVMGKSDVGLAPEIQRVTTENIIGPVNAHSCNADQSCEMNQAKIGGATISASIVNGTTQDSLIISAHKVGIGTSNPATELEVNGRIKSTDLTLVSNLLDLQSIYGSWYTIYGDSTTGLLLSSKSNNRPIRFRTPGNQVDDMIIDGNTGSVTIANLSGSSIAYACIDSTGKLFRKATPCV